jgi:hypothetical protein
MGADAGDYLRLLGPHCTITTFYSLLNNIAKLFCLFVCLLTSQ